MSGQAASYYNPNQGFDAQGQSGYTNGYQQNGNYQPPAAEPKPPPPYPENAAPPPQSGQTFDQAFKVDGPKYNDIWAGLLVRY
jgi:hypothetical protein